MENTLENKAKFIAQHIGQRLDENYYHAIIRGIVQEGKTQSDWKIKTQHLSIPILDAGIPLKSLQSITDEDAIEVAYLHWPDYRKTNHNVDVEWVKRILETISQNSRISDYLRSKGHAIPWMGLSVEELVNRGWVRIKEG